METLNEIKLQSRVTELEKSVAALEKKIFNVKKSVSKNVEILKRHHKSHLQMINDNPDSEYLKGLASDSEFQIKMAEMNEEHILQILLYF
ncbi:hypothetical protein UFOVP627_9 [uncultured Caudovirales phage]|uniref:Uncharacterized protein n=1 Tax=uncultured Caudovirales phage TaxID=2100421 RepID=A0A6J5NDD6_9CAUD|nr:hypothetical protein UFOVP627_9 [uncultured Caudovirales phage]